MLKSYKGKYPSISGTAFIEESAQVIGDVHVGHHASIWFQAVVRGDIMPIRIGDYSNVQDGCILHVVKDKYPTIIEDWVTLGHGVIAHGCVIRSHCLIGMRATLLDDVEIGEGSIVAAAALVAPGTKVPPRSLIMGIPAKVVRTLSDAEVALIDQYAKNYLEYKEEYQRNP
ncbi:MAG: gamma carbonic anhydrase family protein [Acidobacteria bacterium]|nr:gamma carbonic anhydrase family protein [Acidobacteriota bacterium]MBI3655727.1 gamma carbonic anhydrase family protein [Acidobacteriota bacterium]